MTINFSQFIGELKKIEVDLEMLSNNIDENFDEYTQISENCVSDLEELLRPVQEIDNKIYSDIKDKLNRILQVYKKELEPSFKIINNKFKQLDNNLSKTIKKVDAFNEKAKKSSKNKNTSTKNLLTQSENLTIMDLIKKISGNLEAYRTLIEPINENLNTIQKQIDNIQDYIKALEYSQDMIKLMKSLDDFINKTSTYQSINNINNYNDNNDLLLDKLVYLTGFLKNLNVNETESTKQTQENLEETSDHEIKETDEQESINQDSDQTLELQHKDPQLFLNQFALQKIAELENAYIEDGAENSNLTLDVANGNEVINLSSTTRNLLNYT